MSPPALALSPPPGNPAIATYPANYTRPFLWHQPFDFVDTVVYLVVLDVEMCFATNISTNRRLYAPCDTSDPLLDVQVRSPYNTTTALRAFEATMSAFNRSAYGRLSLPTRIIVETLHVTNNYDALDGDMDGVNNACANATARHGNITFCGIFNIEHYSFLGLGTESQLTTYTQHNSAAMCIFVIFGDYGFSVIAHEIAHCLGIDHAGALATSGHYDEYGDIDVGGYPRHTSHDSAYDDNIVNFNIVSRYQVGWIPTDQLAINRRHVTLRALDAAPYDDGMMSGHIILCSFCSSITPASQSASNFNGAYFGYGGQLFLSLRTSDALRDVQRGSYTTDSDAVVWLQDRLHLHFYLGNIVQPGLGTAVGDSTPLGRQKELWTTLRAGESVTIPGSSSARAIYIYVCALVCHRCTSPDAITHSNSSAEYANVTYSNTSVADAIAACA